jgi:hypothetical protein
MFSLFNVISFPFLASTFARYCFLLASSLVRSRTATQKRKKKYIFTAPFNLPCLYANRSWPYQLTFFLQKATSRVIEFLIHHTSLHAFIIASNGKKTYSVQPRSTSLINQNISEIATSFNISMSSLTMLGQSCIVAKTMITTNIHQLFDISLNYSF